VEHPTGSGEPADSVSTPPPDGTAAAPTVPSGTPPPATVTERESTAQPPETPAPGAARPAPADAFVAGRKDEVTTRDRHRPGAFLKELPVLVLIAFGLAIVLKTFLVQAFYIPSGSMEPTLKPGDRVLVMKAFDTPQRGDIVVFEDPKPGKQPDRGLVGGFLHWLSEGLGFARPADEDFIKRVIGLPGETVELRNGTLLVDGLEVDEPYLRGPIDTRDFGPVRVPRDALFVLGDNRLNSNDSRYGLGFVPRDKVVGEAFVVIWPPSRIGWLS
jgi:signal peptidase I